MDVGFYRFAAFTVHGPMIIHQWTVIVISGQFEVTIRVLTMLLYQTYMVYVTVSVVDIDRKVSFNEQ